MSEASIFPPQLMLLITSLLGLMINMSISLSGQNWARLRSQRYSAVLLPPAALIITWSISDNLALSLGMIGALSIVRFRTPIKNPFELVIFFCYLIIGISAGVDLSYSLYLFLAVVLSPVLVILTDVPLTSLSIFGRKINSKVEFSEDPVQMIVQLESESVSLPESVAKHAISSVSFTPVQSDGGFIVDITASFNTLDDAMSCLQHIKSTATVLHGTVQVIER
ncbi:MAG: DUF4956 domain-containing protein [Pseudomonadota bacterium]